MSTLWNELRFALRIFRREPIAALVALVSLAAGIAATTVIFSVVYTVLLAPPVYHDAGRLVVLHFPWHTQAFRNAIPQSCVDVGQVRDQSLADGRPLYLAQLEDQRVGDVPLPTFV